MIDLSQAFRHKTDYFPGLGTSGRVVVPKAAKSELDPQAPNASHVLPWGAVEAVGRLLAGEVGLHFSAHTRTLEFHAQSKGGTSRVSRVQENAGNIHWENAQSHVRAFMHLIGEAAVFKRHPELFSRWQALLRAAREAAGQPLPLSKAHLSKISMNQAVQHAVFAVCDTLYFTMKQDGSYRSDISVALSPQPSYPDLETLLGQRLSGNQTVSHVRLARRIIAGQSLRALLAGPSGIGKTRLAKVIALEHGLTPVAIRGREGLEDRELIGGIYPTAHGPRWIDGPVARAFRLGMQGIKTCLIVDELMRFNQYHRSLFIGLVDELSAAELSAVLGTTVPDGTYYLLELPGNADPTGQAEMLYTRTENLVMIHTTNLGASYTQSGELDPALKRRYHLIEFVEPLNEDAAVAVYRQYCPAGALAAYQLELASRQLTAEHGFPLAESLNTGVCQNYLQEVALLLTGGHSLRAALSEALEYTVIPFCCELDDGGKPDPAGRKALQTALARIVKELQL